MFARARWSCWCKSREEAHGCTTTFLTKLFDAELDFDQALAQAEEWGEEEFNVDKKLTDKGCDSILRNEDVFCDAGPSTPSSSGRKAHTSSAGIGKSDAGEPAEKKRRISSKQSVASSPSGSSTQSSSSPSSLPALPFRRTDGCSTEVAETLVASVQEYVDPQGIAESFDDLRNAKENQRDYETAINAARRVHYHESAEKYPKLS